MLKLPLEQQLYECVVEKQEMSSFVRLAFDGSISDRLGDSEWNEADSIRFEIGRFFRGRILCVGHSSLDLDLS